MQLQYSVDVCTECAGGRPAKYQVGTPPSCNPINLVNSPLLLMILLKNRCEEYKRISLHSQWL